MEPLRRLSLSLLADQKEPESFTQQPSPSLVMVVPLITTAEEEEECKKIDLQAELKAAIMHEDLLEDIPSYLSAKTLAEARAEAVELILRLLHPSQGFDVKLFTSIDKDELFVCLRMSEDNALKVSDNCDYALQMDESALEKLNIEYGEMTNGLVPAYVKFDSKYTDYIKQYEMETGGYSHLRQVDHIRVLYDLITDHIDIKTWQRENVIKCLIPNHSRPKLAHLANTWGNFKLFFTIDQPLDEVRDYFGESVAFYFAFVQFCVKAVLCIIPFSILIKIYEEVYLDVTWSSGSRMAYSLFLIFWSTMFIELWKRHEARLCNRWGQDVEDFSSVKDQENLHFKGVLAPWEGDSNVKVVLPDPKQRKIGMVISSIVCIIFLIITLTLVASNLYLRGYMREHGQNNSAVVCGLLLSVQIKIIDKIWDALSLRLTLLEKHRLEKDFNHSRSKKLMMIKFPNAFSGMVYIAYFQEFVEGCPPEGCMMLLRTQMILVFTVYTLVGVWDVFRPFISVQRALIQERKSAIAAGLEVRQLGMLEMQAKLDEYDLNDLSTDYADIMFPLFFIMIFGLAFPLAPLITIIAYFLQVRADAWKLIHICQRAFPDKANGIGEWRLKVLELVGYAAVFANWGLIVFQCEPFASYDTSSRLLCFFIGEQVLVMFKAFMAGVLIPDEPEDVRVNKVRHRHQAEKLFGTLLSEENLKAIPLKEKPPIASYPGLLPSDPYFEEPMIE